MKILIKPNDKYPMDKVVRIFANAIERKGYSVYNDEKKKSYGVMNIDQNDQDKLKTMVIKKCDHYGLKYEIIYK